MRRLFIQNWTGLKETLRLKLALLAGAFLAGLFALFSYLEFNGVAPVIHLHYTALIPLSALERTILGILAFFSILCAAIVLYYGLRENKNMA